MLRYARTTVAASLMLLLGSAGAVAQQGMDPSQVPPEAQELMAELQQIQAQLEPIQAEALQDPEILAEQQTLGEEIQAAMAELDPSTPDRMARLQELVTEAQAAQAAQDAEAVQVLMTEAQGIQARLQEAQAQALERPEIAPRVEAFQKQLQAKMVEIDPEAEPLIQRAADLDEELTELMGNDG